MKKSLLKKLVDAGRISEAQLKVARQNQATNGGSLEESLVKLGFIDEKAVAKFLSSAYKIPYVDISKLNVDAEAIRLIPVDIARKYCILPVFRSKRELSVVMKDPLDLFAIKDIEFLTGLHVVPLIAEESVIKGSIEDHYQIQDEYSAFDQILKSFDTVESIEGVREEEEEEEENLDQLKMAAETAPVVRLTTGLISQAIKQKASDIHLEPFEHEFRIRFRVDGTLRTILTPPKNLQAAVISRFKVLSKLNIAERRLPQDGRMRVKYQDKVIDFRVSTMPGLYGEKVVFRLLDKSSLQLDMTKLGFEEKELQVLERAINSPYGMILVTGPTGSGKTTTLYSALAKINNEDVNIMTAEDPIEYDLKGINQFQIKEKIGMTFAAALRSFLRQDPDVIMVGEIRDLETAEIAVKAAMTGHLVLSTLHTNDAPSAVTRLIDMEIQPFLVASSVVLVVAQRLVRRICPECKDVASVPASQLSYIGFSPQEIPKLRLYGGRGCPKCNGTGYKGRLGLYEVMPITDPLMELISRGTDTIEIQRKAIELGMNTLRENGLKKIRQGLTTVDEIIKATAER